MKDTTRYNVITSSHLQIGYESEKVQSALVTLFDIPADKAGRIVKRKQLMKKNVDYESAQNYKEALESIGMVVMIKEYDPDKD